MSAYADPRDWDPKGSASLSSVIAYSQIYNQIVQYDTTDTEIVVCDLCESWEISNGGKTFTFTLRENIMWHDGEDLDANDVIFSMERYADPNSRMGRSGLWRQYALPLDEGGVKLVDDRTIEFNLQFPSGAFIKFLAIDYVKVLPSHLLRDGVDLNLAENVIDFQSGSGPFILDEYQRGNSYKVSKNPNYFKEGRPFFDGIEHFIISDPSTLAAGFKVGQIDMTNSVAVTLSPTQAFAIEDDSEGKTVAVAVAPSAGYGLMLNVKKEPFNDPRVRRAIQLAINYQQWNELVFDNTSGVGCPLMGLAHTFEECSQWPGLRAKDTPGGQDDLAKAKELMAEAGYPEGFQTQYAARQVANYPDQCSVIKEQLKKALGIDGEIITYPSVAGFTLYATSRPAEAEGDWELACQGEAQTVLDVDGIIGGVYLKGATRNYTDWRNDRIDLWFEEQKTEIDLGKRVEIQKEIELFLFSQEDNHWITLGWGVALWLIGEDIKGFHAPQTLQTHFKHEDLWLNR